MERSHSEDADQAVGRPHHRHDPAQHALRDAAQRSRRALQHHPRAWAARTASGESASSTKKAGSRFPPKPRKSNTVVDKNAEACYGCHAAVGAAGETESRPERGRIFATSRATACWRVIRPIENAPDCSNAACHVHPRGPAGAGRDRRQPVAGHGGRADVAAQAEPGVVPGGCDRPGLRPGRGVHLARGLPAGEEADRPAPTAWRMATSPTACRCGSDDELGDLARSFNKMTAEKWKACRRRSKSACGARRRNWRRSTRRCSSSEKMASIGKLAATVAHEINNPLFGILTYARLTLRGMQKLEFAGARRRWRSSCRPSSARASAAAIWCKSLLTFSRQAPSQREPQDLNMVVHRAVQLVKHKLRCRTSN